MDPEVLSAGTFCTQVQNMHPSDYIPSSLLPYFWSTAMPCPFQENVQDASTASEKHFSCNARFKIYCQKEEKILESGIIQSY